LRRQFDQDDLGQMETTSGPIPGIHISRSTRSASISKTKVAGSD